MKKILSTYKWYINDNISVTGSIRIGENLLSDKKLATWFAASKNIKDLKEKLLHANGQFALVIEKDDEVWAATDRLRTIPLFYQITDNLITISDSANTLVNRSLHPEIDENSASEFLATGYTLNNHTLIKDLFQIEAGEIVILKNKVQREFYFDFYTDCIYKRPFDHATNELVTILHRIFLERLSALSEKFIVVPLSGGYDSRLIANMCKKYHPENLLCYTYGRADNREVAPAKEVARRLNLPWVNIIYDEKLVRGFIRDSDFKKYYAYASELSSMFFMQEYFAVQYLKHKNLVPWDSVFIPGFSGNILAGGHLRKSMWHSSKENTINTILRNHFILNKINSESRGNFINAIEEKISVGNISPWLMYENWEMKERQSKFITNSSRAFTFFGFDCDMPFWDNELLDFFKCLPFRYKLNKSLYDFTLTNCIFKESNLNFSKELNPKPFQLELQLYKNKLKGILPYKLLSLFINYQSPVLYDVISKYLIFDKGVKNFVTPPEPNNYNSYLVQWYLLKAREFISTKENKDL